VPGSYPSTLEEIIAGMLREELKSPVTIFVENGLDQDVTIQVKGNRVKSTSGAINVGASFTVAKNSNDARTLTPDTSGWLPYIYVELQCTTAPSSGGVTVYLVRTREDQVKLVDALEIRDTSKHDPTSDPNKIFIQEW